MRLKEAMKDPGTPMLGMLGTFAIFLVCFFFVEIWKNPVGFLQSLGIVGTAISVFYLLGWAINSWLQPD